MTNEVNVTLTVEEREALRSVKRLEDSIDKLSKNAATNFKKVDNSVSTFKGTLGAILASNVVGKIGSGLFSLAKGSFDAAANVERLKTQFQVLTGSQEKAAQLFKELTDFSATTPFQLNDIADASAKLISFGFSADNVTEKIKAIGEVAAGSNADLKEVALIYGQVASAGKLTGERLLQLQERAIPIGSALAKSLGVAENRVRDLVSQGVVGFNDFEKAFRSLSEQGGIFEGAIGKQSKTINGTVSTLKDNFEILSATIGELFSPAIIAGAQLLTSTFQVLNKAIGGSTVEGRLQGIATEIININATLADSNKLQEASRNGGKSVEELTAIYQKQKEVLMARAQELAKGQKLLGPSPEVKKANEEAQTLIDSRRKLNAELAQLREDERIAKSEAAIFQAQFDSEKQIEEIKKIKDFENAKAQAKYDAAIEANKLIQDLEARQIANDKAFTEKRIAQAKAEQKANATIRNIELADRNAFFNSAISLSNSKNKTLAAIGKAAGLIQIAQATPPAVASSFNYGTRLGGPPLGFAFAGIALSAQLAQAAKLNAGSFANGGFIGGSSYSGDKLTANVNSGEAVLNTRQQRNFMDLANNGMQADNAVFDLLAEVRALSSAVMQQPIVVQVSGREIARTVRDERRAGFEI